jgi:hypothetical protein
MQQHVQKGGLPTASASDDEFLPADRFRTSVLKQNFEDGGGRVQALGVGVSLARRTRGCQHVVRSASSGLVWKGCIFLSRCMLQSHCMHTPINILFSHLNVQLTTDIATSTSVFAICRSPPLEATARYALSMCVPRSGLSRSGPPVAPFECTRGVCRQSHSSIIALSGNF